MTGSNNARVGGGGFRPPSGGGGSPPNDGGGGGGGGGGNVVPELDIDPVEFVTEAFAGFVESFANGIGDVLDAFQHLVFGINAPGSTTDPATWGAPEGGLWSGAWWLFWTLAPLAIVVLTMQAMSVAGRENTREGKAKLWEIGKAAVMVFVGWPVAIGGLHLFDAISMGLVPDGTEFMSTPGSVSKLGLGLVVGACMLAFQSGTMVVAIGVVLAEHVLLIAAVAGWPIWWAMKPADNGFSNAASGIGLSMYFGVAGAKVVQAAIAALIFNTSWEIANVSETFVTVVASGVGLLVAFVGIPIVVGRNFIPEAMTVLGSPAVSVAEDYATRGRETAADAANEYASSARANVRSKMPNSVPSPSWASGSSSRWAGEVPEDYSPSPEPGASTSGSTMSETARELPGETSESQASSQKRRIDNRLNNRGAY
ncbi:uncharacterized protein HVO_C0034 (plasmid) [Haloferax volcanii DS2]|uniref:Uncharacterized protein n=1 Tax=Haloferax volcanii (strain ATCC 29605 / DSM 3757 / JCM 8879 / NBRC 14742 / NCIMB 2012 / VKM B-1768 / DS2) TaxID=309800 RepID=D4H0C2_HALVD|nr:hypothetical protein [Haloferax volcanii]ADE05250.1 uncharacterized protein HVO_C0034 [Haloferax volcanii DS2]